VVIVNLYSGIYYSLRGTAAQVWIRTVQNYSVNEILTDFLLIYEDITTENRQQVSDLITDLLDKNLITGAQNRTAAKIEFDSTLPKKPFAKPEIEVFLDMQEILLLDPVHDVDKNGWPVMKDHDKS
jgi:hypothetical protein